MPDRLDERDHEIWARYVGGWTQARLAATYGVSQQRISQVLAEVRESVGDDARTDAALLARERTDALLAAVWPAAMEGDTRAVTAALKVLERQAKALGTDAVEPIAVTFERHLDDQGHIVVDALTAALEVLQLDEGQRQLAVRAAQARLLGEPLPEPLVPVVDEGQAAQAAMEKRLRELTADEPGVDVDALLAEVDEEEGRRDG
ncbi:hypothetical protein [Streptomyces sp. A012304]|uniref:hypothetical protein n=1 Tax=Streptomyces sp. A012304 TaxID=375446 RepID=UPI00222FA2F5|nr:hypothetical protein [Streptomyces sp. A012304]GKQ37185.1 hypothetical protein ALMP_37240 [Streptomyces sp. A012304]